MDSFLVVYGCLATQVREKGVGALPQPPKSRQFDQQKHMMMCFYVRQVVHPPSDFLLIVNAIWILAANILHMLH